MVVSHTTAMGDSVTEYSVLNGQLYDLHHVCAPHLCRPTFALSLIDCPWRMAPTDPRSMLTLKCHCNNGIRCIDGVCDFRLVGDFAPCSLFLRVRRLFHVECTQRAATGHRPTSRSH